ncbi:MAG: nucleotidyltransferase domain-containing protein [Lachnospiraceae bacterium]|nr:nucleotidyltransferase domain-containing protein [Lachnospiraceae bacterium]
MRYKDFEGTIEELVDLKLKEIEEKENVKILHAIESGSRAWGFASPDSDYDVRFIYVRPVEYYIRLEDTKDFIDWELDETLDINGWDLQKVLRHFHKSNATLFEWSNSPVIYKTTSEWQKIKQVSEKYFSCKSSMYHYYGTANKNYNEYLLDDMVKYKKYFYVLRPILACKWIEDKKCAPPVLFSELAENVLEDEMREVVDNLLAVKMKMSESEKGRRIDELNKYISVQLSYYKEKAADMKDDRNPDWLELNRIFAETVKGKENI